MQLPIVTIKFRDGISVRLPTANLPDAILEKAISHGLTLRIRDRLVDVHTRAERVAAVKRITDGFMDARW